MLTAQEEAYILDQAYVPEHCIRLMTHVSGGEPFLMDDFFICCKDSWTLLIGYPLEGNFNTQNFESVFSKVKKRFRPDFISLVAPEMPSSLAATCQESQSDAYFTLETEKPVIRSPLKRNLRKARQNLRVESSSTMQEEHQELMHEFVARTELSERVKRLLFKMPEFVARADTAFVLNAWDKANKLAAFYVVDLEAKRFSNYIMGCHSKKNYVLGASDLLLFELINLSLEYDKPYIHLGLGVNAGIRRFKAKWGAVPTRRYEMCELAGKGPSILDTLRAFGNSR
ncbi:MAG: hypothetical protein KAS40_07200 [Desulfobacterales bacterium]|nr:hypothetical protein [Desulfobacterales bacterium]